MNEKQKKEISVAFQLLSHTLKKNKCSLATDNTGKLFVFSTEEYEQNGNDLTKCSGVVVELRSLVG
jgi:hypothetical protein|nr:MAG TPA: hypothetical protein [Caudoviricetes sp.]